MAARASSDLRTAGRPESQVSQAQLRTLAGLGPWGRYLAARHPNCPLDLLEDIARDPDWRVRTGLLDNPNTPISLLENLLGTDDTDEIKMVRS